MAKKIENKKGFLVLEISRDELIDKLGEYGSTGICDYCASTPKIGYYIAVLNQWYCPKCYEDFIRTGKRYEEDVPFERKNFDLYCQIFGVRQDPVTL